MATPAAAEPPTAAAASWTPRRWRWRPPATGLLLLLLLVLGGGGSAWAAQNDFSFYPAGARACLTRAAAASACRGDSARDLNACLCGGASGFAEAVARCVGDDDDGDVALVYRTMKRACADSQTPLGVRRRRFLAWATDGQGAASTTTTTKSKQHPSPTAGAGSVSKTAPTPTPPPPTTTTTWAAASATASTSGGDGRDDVDHVRADGNDGGGGGGGNGGDGNDGALSNGAVVAISTSVTAGGLGLVGLVAWFLYRHRRRRGCGGRPGEAEAILDKARAPPTSAATATDHKAVWSPYEWPAAAQQDQHQHQHQGHQVYEMDGTSAPQQLEGV